MRTRGIVAVLVVCAANTGCSQFLHDSLRNLVETPLESVDECRMKFRNRCRAEEAWRVLSEGSSAKGSRDFEAGFIAGYADYLNNGGNGNPPAVPPYRYRTVRYQTPEGVEAINRWYAGWRHGALMAKASGIRELEVIPLSAPPINAVERDFGPPIELPPTADQLPLPRSTPNK